MTPTLLEVLHRIDAWEPPEGFGRELTLLLDSSPRCLLLAVSDGPVMAVMEVLRWEDDGGLAAHLGALDGHLDRLHADALAARVVHVLAGRAELEFSEN